MSEELHSRIDDINEERPAPNPDEASLPVFVTAVLSVFLMVVLVWLFVPGRVQEVRALEREPQSQVQREAPADHETPIEEGQLRQRSNEK